MAALILLHCKNFCSWPRGWLGTDQAPQGMVTAPRLPELQEHSDNALRRRVALLGCPAQGQELNQ